MATRSAALCAVAGAIAGRASQAALGFTGPECALLSVGQCGARALMGGALGIGMSAVVPNLRMSKARLPGMAGGTVGGAALVPLGRKLGGFTSRLLGAAIVGAAIGPMVAVAEAYFAEAMLRMQ